MGPVPAASPAPPSSDVPLLPTAPPELPALLAPEPTGVLPPEPPPAGEVAPAPAGEPDEPDEFEPEDTPLAEGVPFVDADVPLLPQPTSNKNDGNHNMEADRNTAIPPLKARRAETLRAGQSRLRDRNCTLPRPARRRRSSRGIGNRICSRRRVLQRHWCLGGTRFWRVDRSLLNRTP
jgi:hypothetical protein